MDHTFEKTPRNRIKRGAKRARYEKETVYRILDAGFLCHVAFTLDGQPFQIPTCYGREGEQLYLHGAIANRMLTHLEKGFPVCISVTHLDGLVLARSAFHHSVNYRSVILFGEARLVPEQEKEHALKRIVEQMLPGRWEESRKPTPGELKITKVLAVSITEAAAKIRSGGPVDEEADYKLPVWAGVLPLHTIPEPPVPDPALPDTLPLPPSIRNMAGGRPV